MRFDNLTHQERAEFAADLHEIADGVEALAGELRVALDEMGDSESPAVAVMRAEYCSLGALLVAVTMAVALWVDEIGMMN